MQPDATRTRMLAVALARLGWNNLLLASMLGCSEKLIRKWLTGETPPPVPVLVWLQSLAAFVEAHPAPGWRRRKRKDHPQGLSTTTS